MVRAVVFDLDGVIVDSERHWALVEPDLLEGLAPGWKAKAYERLVGTGIRDIHRMLADEHGLKTPWPEFRRLYDGIAAEIYGRKAVLLDGARELIDALAARRVPLALASSSPRAWVRTVLDRFGLAAFASVVGGDDVEGPGKPDPAIHRRAAAGLGLACADCVAIEDSRNGVLAAKAAGMACVGLRNGFNDAQDLSAADLEAAGLRALTPERLLGLPAGAPR